MARLYDATLLILARVICRATKLSFEFELSLLCLAVLNSTDWRQRVDYWTRDRVDDSRTSFHNPQLVRQLSSGDQLSAPSDLANS